MEEVREGKHRLRPSWVMCDTNLGNICLLARWCKPDALQCTACQRNEETTHVDFLRKISCFMIGKLCCSKDRKQHQTTRFQKQKPQSYLQILPARFGLN